MRPLLTLLLLAADAGAPAPAPTSPLDGTWDLDTSASTDPGPLLDRLGANFMVKAVAAKASATQVVSLDGDVLSVEVRNGLGVRKSSLVLDGRAIHEGELFGKKTRATSVREGAAVVSTGTLELEGGKVAQLTSRREVRGDGAMTVTSRVTPPGEAELTVVRVFRRRP